MTQVNTPVLANASLTAVNKTDFLQLLQGCFNAIGT